MAHTFCPIPWKHLSTSPNGDLRVCCQCIYPPFGKSTKADGSRYNAAVDDDREVRNTEIFKEIRSQMLKGEKPKHCEFCWKEEELGKSSRRLDELELEKGNLEERARASTLPDGTINVDEFPVKHFDLRLGNQCNFKCRSCSPRDSNSWYDDYVKMTLQDSWLRVTPPKYDGEYAWKKTEKSWVLDTKDFSWHEESALLKKLEKNVDHIERIYFTGGEPTLIKAHWRLLEKLIEKGRAEHIWLDYNTNVSHITGELLNVWSKFKHVYLGCSIDGIGDKAPYLRPPVEWSTIERNLERIAFAGGNIHASLCTTISAYNILYYPEVIEYLWSKEWRNFFAFPMTQVLEYPEWLNPQLLPKKTKLGVREKYEKFYLEKAPTLPEDKKLELRAKLDYVLGFMDQADRSDELKHFLRKTEQMDRLRNQEFKKTFPELFALLI